MAESGSPVAAYRALRRRRLHGGAVSPARSLLPRRLRGACRLRRAATACALDPPNCRGAAFGAGLVRIRLCSAADGTSADRASHLADGIAALRALSWLETRHAQARAWLLRPLHARRRVGARGRIDLPDSGAQPAELDSRRYLLDIVLSRRKVVPAGRGALASATRHDVGCCVGRGSLRHRCHWRAYV